MSTVLLGAAMKYSRAKGAAFTLLLIMADIASEQHEYEVWMARENLAARAHISRRSVDTALLQLVELGEIVVVARPGQSRFGVSRPTVTYRVTVSDRRPTQSGVPRSHSRTQSDVVRPRNLA